MKIRGKYNLIALLMVMLAMQAVLPFRAFAATYVSQAVAVSADLLSGTSASGIANFHYNLASLPAGSSVRLQFSKDNASWYSAGGASGEWTTISAIGGADLDLAAFVAAASWASGDSFYYKLELNATPDLTQTPAVEDIRLDYTPAAGYEKTFIFDDYGRVGIGTTAPWYTLDVNGTINADFYRVGGVAALGTTGGKVYVGSAADYDFGIYAGAADRLFIQNSTGNVGIGTTSPGSLLHLNGALGALSGGLAFGDGDTGLYENYDDNFRLQTAGVDRITIDDTGNVGIGTTAPSGLLHVAGGQCVTGDTLLRVRRRRKRQNERGEWIEEEYFEDCRIDQIKAGDEILTLDENTGRLTVSRVNALMDMGVKEIYKLTTATGKTIRTTANHPYLAVDGFDNERAAVFVDSANFEMSCRFCGLEKDYVKMDKFFFGAMKKSAKTFRFYKVDFGGNKQRKFFDFLNIIGAKIVSKPIKVIKQKQKANEHKANFDVELAVDAVELKEKYDTAIIVSGDSDFAYLAEHLQKAGKKTVVISPWRRTGKELRQQADMYFDLRNMPFVGRIKIKRPPVGGINPGFSPALTILSQVHPFVKGAGRWTKVSQLREGQMIAVAGDNAKPQYERIAEIEKLPAEQVYDIEVEGTHNFVGNGIVAHNTYLQGADQLNTSFALRVQDSAAADKFVVTNAGNVGIGTTTPNATVDIKGEAFSPLTGTVAVTSGGPYVVGSGTLFTSELNEGDAIKIGSEIFAVSSITDDANLIISGRYLGETASGLTAYYSGKDLISASDNESNERFKITSGGELQVASRGKFGSKNSAGYLNLYFWTKNNFASGISTYKRGNNSDIDGAVSLSAELGYHNFYGWDGTAYARGAFAIAKATEGWTDSAHGSSYSIYTTPNGSITNTARFFIGDNGNIGIGGATNKLSRLTVKAAASFNSSGTVSTTAGSATVSGLDTFFTTQLGIGDRITINGETKTITAIASNTSLTADSVFSASNSDVAMAVMPSIFRIDNSGGTAKLVINDGGNVGIGTTSPAELLDVNGRVRLAQTTAPETTADRLYNVSGNLLWNGVNLTAAGALPVGTEGQMLYNNAGAWSAFDGLYWDDATSRLGIGTTTPIYKFNVAGANAGTGVGDASLLGIVNTDTTANNTIGLAFGQANLSGTVQTVAGIDLIGVSHADGAQSGALAFSTRNAGSWDERLRIDPSGNVGIGTTAPSGLLHVAGGQCVTGDTLLRVRRRRKRQNERGEWIEEEYFEDCRIDQVKAGDEILTLDENTGRLAVSRVNALMDMGVKEIYKLTTATGKTIRTTANHPYLARKPKTARTYAFIDASNIIYGCRQSGWRMDFKKLYSYLKNRFGASRIIYYAGEDLTNAKQQEFYSLLRKWGYELVIKPTKTYDDGNGKITKKANVDVDLTFEAMLYFGEYDRAVFFTGDGDFYRLIAHCEVNKQRVWLFGNARRTAKELKKLLGYRFSDLDDLRQKFEFIKQNEADPTIVSAPRFMGSSYQAQNCVSRGDDGQATKNPSFSTGESPCGDSSLATAISSLSGNLPFVKGDDGGKWTKVADICEGMEIATADENSGRAVWERIAKIEKLPAEQVYDIEVEGTHNFVGNGIVAHNTYLQGADQLNTSFALRVQDSAEADKFVVTNAGNVGIGTTSPGYKFTVQSEASETTLGDSLLTNGDFATNVFTGWTAGANWSAATGAAVHTAGSTGAISQDITVTTGQYYQIDYTETGDTAGSLTFAIGSASVTRAYWQAASVTIKTTGSTGAQTFSITPTSDYNGTLDNITVKLVTPAATPAFVLLNADGTAGGVQIKAGGSGLNNIFIGSNVGRQNTTGYYNNALGANSLYSNTTGNYNNALGANSLYSNTTGYYNNALGASSLYSNTTGYYNNALGYQSLYSNTTGNYNNALGREAGRYNETGSENNYFGYRAGGYGAGAVNSHSGTTAVGSYALYNLTTGNYNLGLGYKAGENLTSGSGNVIIGYDIDAPSATASNQLNIGNLIFGTGLDGRNGTLSSGNVGIGTTAPTGKLTVRGDSSGAVADLLRLENLGTAAVSSGAGVQFVMNRTTGGATEFGRLDMLATNIDNTAYSGALQFKIAANGLLETVAEFGSANIVLNRPLQVNVAGDTGISYDLQFMNTGVSNIVSNGPLTISAGTIYRADNLTLTTRANEQAGDFGTAATTTATTLTDSGKAWTADEWIGGTITIVAGAGKGQTQTITDNDATVITVADWDATLGDPSANSVYRLSYAPAGDVLANIANANAIFGGFKVLGNDNGGYAFRVAPDGSVHIGGEGAGESSLFVKQNITAYGGILSLRQLDISSAGTPVATTATSGGSCADSTAYYYKVTAINGNGETTGTAQFTVTTGASGTNINLNTIAWSAVTGATGYKIYRSTENNDWDGDANDQWVDGKVVAAPAITYDDDCAGDTASLVPPTANTTGGKLAINTAGVSPTRRFEVLENTGAAPQMKIISDSSNYSEFYVDATGDLSLKLTGSGGDDLILLDENLKICASGDFGSVSCPTAGFTISGTGNLIVENKVIADKFEQICPTGYVWVPGSAKHGTLPGFCVMKYEAKDAGGGVAESKAADAPWTSVTQENARAYCQALGEGYHLVSEAEWMTIAENIAATPINDIDAVAGLQLATGHTDNDPANSLAAGTDPVVSGCNLRLPLSDAANAFDADCQLRDNGGEVYGYSGTGGNFWNDIGYLAGGNNKSQLRVHALSNGNTVWDIAGNVYEWTDAIISQVDQPGISNDGGAGVANWGEWNVSYYLVGAAANSRPPDDGWTGANGIGRLYTYGRDETATTTYRAFLRGGDWNDTSYAGVFALNLSDSPATSHSNIGFRCAR